MTMLPQGFRLAVAAADFRGKGRDRNDLALAVSDAPAVAAGVFTTNLFCAAPVLVAREKLEAAGAGRVSGPEAPRAVLINSGQANACTGQRGLDDRLARQSSTPAQDNAALTTAVPACL